MLWQWDFGSFESHLPRYNVSTLWNRLSLKLALDKYTLWIILFAYKRMDGWTGALIPYFWISQGPQTMRQSAHDERCCPTLAWSRILTWVLGWLLSTLPTEQASGSAYERFWLTWECCISVWVGVQPFHAVFDDKYAVSSNETDNMKLLWNWDEWWNSCWYR
jgi:hypothetical protein